MRAGDHGSARVMDVPLRLRLLLLRVVVLAAGLGLAGPALCHDVKFTYFPRDQGMGYCSVFCASANNCTGNEGCKIDDATRDPALSLIPFGIGNNRDIAVRFMRDEAVQMWDKVSGANASVHTFFVMRVSGVVGYPTGDGMTFLMAPEVAVPAGSQGGNLGLFPTDQDGNSLPDSDPQTLAIKFDTHNNTKFGDPLAPYVGLAVNTLRTDAFAELDDDLLPQMDFLHNKFGVWIDYDAVSQNLQVAILLWPEFGGFDAANSLKRSARVAFNYSLDLRQTLGEWSYVGFSASTGHDFEINEIFYWAFATTGLGNKKKPLPTWVEACLIAAAALLLLLLLCYFCLPWCRRCCRRRHKKKRKSVLPSLVLGEALMRMAAARHGAASASLAPREQPNFTRATGGSIRRARPPQLLGFHGGHSAAAASRWRDVKASSVAVSVEEKAGDGEEAAAASPSKSRRNRWLGFFFPAAGAGAAGSRSEEQRNASRSSRSGMGQRQGRDKGRRSVVHRRVSGLRDGGSGGKRRRRRSVLKWPKWQKNPPPPPPPPRPPQQPPPRVQRSAKSRPRSW